MINNWTKRATTTLSCPSGNEVGVRRPGPDLALKAGRIAHILKRNQATPTDIDQQLAYIGSLPDAELNQLMSFARVLICDCVTMPPIVMNPKEGQLGPDDVPLTDFWFIFTWAMNGGPTMPVKLKEGETSIADVEHFPESDGAGVSTGADSEQIQ